MLTIDFETRSTVDLKKSGTWAYAEHPSTEIICMAFKCRNDPTVIWSPFVDRIPRFSADLYPYIVTPGMLKNIKQIIVSRKIEAHNAMFERALWEKIMVPRYGFPSVSPESWRCSAAKAAAHSLPRSLDGACKALDLDVQKDKKGYFLMMKMCKPKGYDESGKPIWIEDPESLVRLFRYCIQDVESEHALSQALPDLPSIEQKVWHMDQAINARGVKFDRKACEEAMKIVEACAEVQNKRLTEITGGAITKATQTQRITPWINEKGLKLKDLTKASVSDALMKKGIPPEVKEVLEIRQSGGKSSTAKLKAFINGACTDDRIRDLFLYHGAGPGRWAGKRLQPQNFPRPAFDSTEACLDLITSGKAEGVELIFGDPIQAISSCLRGMFIADEGKDLVCADFSAIEARVLAWVCGETDILKVFKEGTDLYKVEACGIFNTKYDEVEYAQRLVGKVATLALGYQGGWKAFMAMAKAYGLHPPDEFVEARYSPMTYKGLNRKLTQEEAAFKVWASPFVTAWRENRPAVVNFWWAMEDLVRTVLKTGKPKGYRGIAFGLKDGFLQCRFPSGRFMKYYDPLIITQTKRFINKKGEIYDKEVETITFMGTNSTTKKWERKETYGGKITENIVQGIANDLLREALLRTEAKSYKTVLHVHDEGVSEVPEGKGSLMEYETLMAVQPEWAKGLPLKAEGWRGKRYRK